MSLVRRVWLMMSVYYADMLAYRAEIYLWVIARILPFIMMSIWTKGAEQRRAAIFR